MQEPKTFIITLRCGRLANRLAIFANLAAYAEEHHHRVVNFTFHSYAHLFESTAGDVYCRYPAATNKSWFDVFPGVGPLLRKSRVLYRLSQWATVINERLPLFGSRVVTLRGVEGRRCLEMDDPVIQDRIRPARTVFVYEWGLRSTALVKKHAAAIRKHFRPIETLERASIQAVETLRRESDVLVGVHIRQGDYRGWRNGMYFFPTSRYAEWMHEMAARFPGRRVAFLVCSDQPQSASDFSGLKVGFGTNSAVVDLYALAQCDYIVGTVSTFSQWASFYGNKPMFHFQDKGARIELDKFQVSCLEFI